MLGHEAGHILSDHVIYSTALVILLQRRHAPAEAAADLRRAAAAGRQARAARVVPRRRAELRPRGDARQPQPDDHLPDADGDRRRRRLAQAEPRRVRPPGRRVRGLGARLGQAQPLPLGALPDARVPGPPRVGDHEVGPLRRVRPHHVAASIRARRPVDPREEARRRRGVLRGALPHASSRSSARASTRPATRWPTRPTSSPTGSGSDSAQLPAAGAPTAMIQHAVAGRACSSRTAAWRSAPARARRSACAGRAPSARATWRSSTSVDVLLRGRQRAGDGDRAAHAARRTLLVSDSAARP